ncbi:MAG: type II toxin-antitoxin system RelE/ParE family toxin [Verrucomicrobia bacterium]|nr:type II toxin-antitoxin system RelE/ParE family toxin [Verrucomicrobiota bacterium]
MAYRIEIGPKAEAQLARLDAAIAASVERKIVWLAVNASSIVHRRLVGMPEDLAGLCKLRVGDHRILYWIYRDQKLIRLYRIGHRSDIYRDL